MAYYGNTRPGSLPPLDMSGYSAEQEEEEQYAGTRGDVSHREHGGRGSRLPVNAILDLAYRARALQDLIARLFSWELTTVAKMASSAAASTM